MFGFQFVFFLLCVAVDIDINMILFEPINYYIVFYSIFISHSFLPHLSIKLPNDIYRCIDYTYTVFKKIKTTLSGKKKIQNGSLRTSRQFIRILYL